MPPPQVKDVVKDFFKDFGKVFAIRLRRSTKNGRTRRSSTTTDHEDSSIHVHTSSPSPTLSSNSSQEHTVSANEEPGLEASTNVSSPRSSGGVSLAREASDKAQLALPLVQAVASAIPLVGAPMQAAIGGLVTGLQAIDRHNQNKADLSSLTSRLDRLSRELCNASPALDPVEQSRRDSFVRMLEVTSARVTALHERCLASTPVTQAIAGCFTEIDRYQADYLWSSQMQIQRDTREMLVIQQKALTSIESLVNCVQSSLGPTAAQLIGTATRGCVTLIDATGRQHPISVNFCTSFEQFNEMLKVLFKCNSAEAQIQRRYMESGMFDLCIDEGPQARQLTSHQWSRPEVGTTIVMRVIIEQQTTSSHEVSYKCPCGSVNTLGVGSVMYSLERQSGCSIDCRKCGRRFQISRVPSSTNRNAPPSNVDSNDTTDTEMDLLRNFHVRQTHRPQNEGPHSLDEAFMCMWGTSHCNTILFNHQLSDHLREFHGVHGPHMSSVQCLWEDCEIVLRKANLLRHVRERHLRIRYTCPTCGGTFARTSTLRVHTKICLGLRQ